MIQEKELIKSGIKIKKLKINLDLDRLLREVKIFHTLLITRNFYIEDMQTKEKRILLAINQLAKAKACFEKVISNLVTHFEVGETKYLEEMENRSNVFSSFKGNLQVISSRLEEGFEGLDFQRKADIAKNNFNLYLIESFKQMLAHFMESIIIFPIKEALIDFEIRDSRESIVDGKKVTEVLKKDSNLFFWYLFRNMYAVASIEGGEKRQLLSKNKVGDVHYTEINKNRIPKNAEYVIEETEPEPDNNDLSKHISDINFEEYE